MRKIIFTALAAMICCQVYAASDGSDVMTRNADGTCVVNTTTLCSDVRGYKSPTPLLVYIKKDKVTKIEALPNRETPGYFRRLESKFMHLWDGVKVSKVAKMKVDVRTGATFSAKAVEANVKGAVKYYDAHK